MCGSRFEYTHLSSDHDCLKTHTEHGAYALVQFLFIRDTFD